MHNQTTNSDLGLQEPTRETDAQRQATRFVAVAYSYPSSENANRFGFAKHGCFVVETSTSKDRIPKAIAGYDNSPDAFTHATRLVAEGYVHCPYSVSPEFRVYRPLP